MTRRSDERMKEHYERQLASVNARLTADKYDKPRPSQKNPEAFYRRQYIWRHNSFIGHSVMMRTQLNNIIDAVSTTEQTKHIARSILGLVTQLQNSLQKRIDP